MSVVSIESSIMSNGSNKTFDLHFELIAEIINYLAVDNRDVFKFRLCSKLWMSRTTAVLDCVKVACHQKPDLSCFLGSKPKRVVFSGIIPSDDDEISTALAQLASTASQLVLNVLSRNESHNQFLQIGGNLKNLNSLVFKPLFQSPSLVGAFLAWTPHLANLEELEIHCTNHSIGTILEAVSQHCKELKTLVLAGFNDTDTVDLSEHLKSMHSLESIVLTSKCRQFVTLKALCTAETDFDAQSAQRELASILPPQLHNFSKVMMQYTPAYDRQPPMLVHVLGYLFLVARSEEVADFFLNQMVSWQLPMDNWAWGVLLKACIIEDRPTRVRKLILAGVDIWMPLSLSTQLDSGIVIGNAFHLAIRFSSPEVVEALLTFVDWSKITDLSSFRTSSGFTPLHFSGRSGAAWTALYSALKQRNFPNILCDIENLMKAPPIYTIHSFFDGGVSSAPIAISTFILAEAPDLLDSSSLWRTFSPSLFANAFRSTCDVSSAGVEFDYDNLTTMMRQLLEHHCRVMGVSHVSQLDLNALKFKDEIKSISPSRLLLALLIDEDLFHIFRERSSESMSICLQRAMALSRRHISDIPFVARTLANCGADINFVDPSNPEGVSALVLFLQYQSALDADWKAFWRSFWELVDLGAAVEGDRGTVSKHARIFVFHLLARSHKLSDITRFLQLLENSGCALPVNTFLARIAWAQLEAPYHIYYGALERTVMRRLGRPLPENCPSEEDDSETLRKWCPVHDPPIVVLLNESDLVLND